MGHKMSKLKNSLNGKRSTKVVPRKGKARASVRLNENSLEVMLRKAKYQAKNGVIGNKTITKDNIDAQVNGCREKVLSLFNYFGYLAFAKQLIVGHVIPGDVLTIDLEIAGKRITDVMRRLKIAPLLDDAEYMTEIFEIGNELIDLGCGIVNSVNRVAEYETTIMKFMLEAGRLLPPLPNNENRSIDQVIEEVMRTSGEVFLWEIKNKTEKEKVEA